MDVKKPFPKRIPRHLYDPEIDLWVKHTFMDEEEHSALLHEKDKEIARLRAALEFYAGYMDGDNPEFTKGGWQKYPDPKIAKEALAGGNI